MQNRGGLVTRVWWCVLAALLAIATADAQVVKQLTDSRASLPGPAALDDAGTYAFNGTSSNKLGTNPSNAFQIVRWDAASGAGTQLTTGTSSTSPLVSVTDDGVWLAFPSPLDLAGQNHDQSTEVFVMRNDGTSITQLTSDPAPNAGNVSSVFIAGGGTKVLFVSDCDYLGTNAAHQAQLFVINRDGTGLRQLTTTTTGDVGGIMLSDDATRALFVSGENLTGGNADLGSDVFVINTDGTGLRQLTSAPAGYDAVNAALSGNGAKVAFESNADLVTGSNTAHQSEIFVVDFAGTGLRQLTKTSNLLSTPASQYPSLTDDGLTVVYASNQSSLFTNFDGNTEIFRIKSDGTGQKALTSTLLLPNLLPTVSGNGTRVAFYTVSGSFGSNPETAPQLVVMDGNGGTTRQLSDTHIVFQNSPAITPDGTRIVFTQNDRTLGNSQLYRIEADGTGFGAVLVLSSGQANNPSIAADRTTIVFNSDSNQTGGNGDTSQEIFRVRADGTGLAQLTSGASGTSCGDAVIAAGGSVVAFDCDANLTGANADASREVFKVNLDGTGLVQLTNGAAGTTSRYPRVDESGTWVVFESTANMDGGNGDGSLEVWRVRTDGSGLERLTGDPTYLSRGADVSAAGDRIVYDSTADPLGTNPEHNDELFAYEPATATRRQLTSFAAGVSNGARLAGDGSWVWFSSSAAVFESVPGNPSDIYRIPFAGGAIERTGALRSGYSGGIPLLGGGSSVFSIARDGQRAALSMLGDPVRRNPDFLPEIFLVDRLAVPRLTVSRTQPTIVTWDIESGPVRYDVIRGACAQLRGGVPGIAGLGTVACLENDSPDATTAGFGDATAPAAGQAFFFVFRGAQGLASPGSYGTASDGSVRAPDAGDCAP